MIVTNHLVKEYKSDFKIYPWTYFYLFFGVEIIYAHLFLRVSFYDTSQTAVSVNHISVN